MSSLTLNSGTSLQGRLRVPGDKSISHRALLFSAISQGQSLIQGLSQGADVQSTRQCLEQLGVRFEEREDKLCVHGVGLHGFNAPEQALDCGNSGTTMRLLMGLLAGQSFASSLIGDASLSARPMARISTPLAQMGAQFSLQAERYAPVQIQPATLKGAQYELPVASAQVKSALLLAGLYAEDPTVLTGQLNSRDHTEQMLPAHGLNLSCSAQRIELQPGQSLKAHDWIIPGDFSSAAFWLAGAALLPGSDVQIDGVSLNPTRTGFARILKAMGAELEIQPEHEGAEAWGSVRLKYSPLHGIKIPEAEVPFVIDEVPLLMLLASQAKGQTQLRGAAELRVKESDRLAVMAENLQRMGVELTLFEDGFSIEGPQPLQGAHVESHHDHRIAMTFALAALCAEGQTEIQGAEVMAVSYPQFLEDLNRLRPQ